MSAITLLQPKNEPFTVGDINNAFKIPNGLTFSSKEFTIDDLAAICILCKFLIQGIRAHGIFRNLSVLSSTNRQYTTDLGELIKLYDGLKYTVFEGTSATFTKSCIERNDTSYNIPTNFLSKKVSIKNQTDLNKSITPPMRSDILKLIDGMKSIFASSTNMSSIFFSTKPGVLESIPNTKQYNFTANAFTTAKNALSKLITERCVNDENVKNWYIDWSRIFYELVGEMPFFVTNMSYKELGKDPFKNLSSIKPKSTQSNTQKYTIVGRVVSHTGGKSHARTKRAKHATRGSTKCTHRNRTHRKRNHKRKCTHRH